MLPPERTLLRTTFEPFWRTLPLSDVASSPSSPQRREARVSSLEHDRREDRIARGHRKGGGIYPNRRILRTLPLSCSAIFLLGVLTGCSTAPSQPEDDAANNAAAVDALNTWWKGFIPAPPKKAGTVTPGDTLAFGGRAHYVPKHVQTRKEAEDDVEDAQFMEHMMAPVRGFSVKGRTVTVLTNLTQDPAGIGAAQELCHTLGGFVWANDNRQFGLEDIRVTGANEELLSSRLGLRGKVR